MFSTHGDDQFLYYKNSIPRRAAVAQEAESRSIPSVLGQDTSASIASDCFPGSEWMWQKELHWLVRWNIVSDKHIISILNWSA